MLGRDLSQEDYDILCRVKTLCAEDVLGNMVDEAHDRDEEDQKGLIESRLEMITNVMKAKTLRGTFEAFHLAMFSDTWRDFLDGVIYPKLSSWFTKREIQRISAELEQP